MVRMIERVCLLCVFCTLGMTSPLSYGAQPFVEPEDSEPELRQIPKKPSAPPALEQKVPSDIPHCERFFLYRGKKLECDSNVSKDAERLRPIIQDVPRALYELDTYQANRARLKSVAYVGTAGLLAIVAGIFVSHPPFNRDSGSPQVGKFVSIGGGALAVGSLIYGLSLVKTNEAHVSQAVDYYNSAHPNDRIELQFSTRINF